MEEFGKDHLERAIEELSIKQAPECIWEAIQEELEDGYPTDEAHHHLQQAMVELPAKTTSLTFDAIYEALEDEPSVSLAPKHWPRLSFYQLSWAASIIFILVSTLLWWPNPSEEVNIVYTEQQIELAPMLVEFTDMHEQDEVLSFIKANCKAFQQQCSQEEFKELLDQYIQLESDRKELMEVIQQNQEEKQLVQYLVRLEKKKTEVGKKLMQKFI